MSLSVLFLGFKTLRFAFLTVSFIIILLTFAFLENDKLWCHAKNINALNEMLRYNGYYEEIIGEYAKHGIHSIWHQEDNFTLTSAGFIWTYPKKSLYYNSICVLPEIGYSGDLDMCYGICYFI